MVVVCNAGSCDPEQMADHDRSAEPEYPDSGGDPVCWAPRVCPECGLFVPEEPPTSCPRCGAAIGGPDDTQIETN
jgi:rubrerythrin